MMFKHVNVWTEPFSGYGNAYGDEATLLALLDRPAAGFGLVQVLRFENLPLKFDWITLGVGYWILLAAQAIFYRLKRSSFLGMPRHSSAPKAAALLRRWTAT